MKKLASLLLAFLVFSACEDVQSDIKKYMPSVRTVSAELQSDGSVIVTGEILPDGSDELYYIGACMNSTGNPKMHKNQILTQTLNGNQFSVTYPWSSFSGDSAYYFSAFAVNDYGYDQGDAIKLDTLSAPAVTPPCTPTLNRVNFGMGTGSSVVYSTDTLPNFGYYSVVVGTSPQSSFYFQFRDRPTEHVYTTNTDYYPLPGDVYVFWTQGGNNYHLTPGTPVYVVETSPNHWEITVCSAPWLYSSTTYNMTARFSVPY